MFSFYIFPFVKTTSKIRAKAQDELDAKNISFENVQLPCQKAAPIEELKALAEKIFQTGGKWPIVKGGKQISTFDQLDKTEKSAALRIICQGKYAEHQIAFMQITEDLSSGFALTVDSFCTGGGVGTNLILYQEISKASLHRPNSSDKYGLKIYEKFSNLILHGEDYSYDSGNTYSYKSCRKLFSYSDYKRLEKFLEVAKNF